MKKTRIQKWMLAMAITVAALQIPLLMLWEITYDAVMIGCQGLEVTEEGGYVLTFQWDKLGGALLGYLPVILSLTACLILSVGGLILMLKRKGSMTATTVCLYAVTLAACGVLIYSFSRPTFLAEQGKMNGLYLCEYTFFTYLGGTPSAEIVRLFPILKNIKFILLGLHAAGSGALCAMGIADTVRRRRQTPPAAETEPMEPALYEVQGRRKIE